jgi:hypothetical protein
MEGFITVLCGLGLLSTINIKHLWPFLFPVAVIKYNGLKTVDVRYSHRHVCFNLPDC